MQASFSNFAIARPNAEQLTTAEQTQTTKGPLTGRASFRVDWRCVLAIGAIMLLCFGLVVAAPASLNQRQVSRAPANCSNRPTFDHTVHRDYLPSGTVHLDLTADEREYIRLSSGSGPFSHVVVREVFYATSRSYLELADKHEHPADQAVCIHRARDVLRNGGFGDLPSEKIQLEELLLAEAEACSKAAKSAEMPSEKLSWIMRGVKEVDLPRSTNTGSDYGEGHREIPRGNIPSLSNDQKGRCYAAASLWEDAGDIFSTTPNGQEYKPFVNELSCQPSNAAAAAVSYAHAGYFMETGQFTSFDGRSRAAQLYLQAIEQYKRIDTKSYAPTYKARLQENVLTVCLRLRSVNSNAISRDQIFQEFMTAARLYEQASWFIGGQEKTHNLVMQATRLADAAEYAPTLEEALNLYRQARDILEVRWKYNLVECMRDSAFSPHPSNPHSRYEFFKFEESLLAKLRLKVTETEKQLNMMG